MTREEQSLKVALKFEDNAVKDLAQSTHWEVGRVEAMSSLYKTVCIYF